MSPKRSGKGLGFIKLRSLLSARRECAEGINQDFNVEFIVWLQETHSTTTCPYDRTYSYVTYTTLRCFEATVTPFTIHKPAKFYEPVAVCRKFCTTTDGVTLFRGLFSVRLPSPSNETLIYVLDAFLHCPPFFSYFFPKKFGQMHNRNDNDSVFFLFITIPCHSWVCI